MAKQPTDPKAGAIQRARDVQAEAVRLQEERDQVRPTPTQDEIDHARLGVIDIDAEEPDGSAEGANQASASLAPTPAVRSTAPASGASYSTRDSKPA